MSLQRAQSETTSTEFVRWIRYLAQKKKDDLTIHHREDYYLAQIAAMIHNSVSKSPVSIESKLLTFNLAKEKIKAEKPMSVEKASEISKRFWFGLVGRKKK